MKTLFRRVFLIGPMAFQLEEYCLQPAYQLRMISAIAVILPKGFDLQALLSTV
jgi:hypothetical protein